MQKKIIIIAKCFDSKNSGPANIVRGLIRGFEKEQLPYKSVLYKEGISKWTFLKEMLRVLATEHSATVNVHTEGFLIPLMVYLCSFFFRSHRYYLTVHGIYSIESKMNNTYSSKYALVEKLLYTHFQNIICVSEMLQQNINELYGRSDNVLVIPNATDAYSEEQYISGEIKEVISLGGLRKRKGIDLLLKMAFVIKQKDLPIHISLYGSTEGNQDWFARQTEEMQIEKYIEYKGPVQDKEKLYGIIKKADAQLCLSYYDTFNVAIAESLVLGCPCIATDRCGAAYLIDDVIRGIVINEKEAIDSNFDKVIKYITGLNHRTRLMLEKNTRYYAEKLSWKHIVKLYSELQ